MLSAHPEISFPPETQFFRKYLGDKKKRVLLERQGLAKFVKILSADPEFGRSKLDAGKVFLSDTTAPDAPFQLSAAYLRFLEAYAERESAHIVGDKDPRLLENLGVLGEYFPDAAVIHIIRDPRDVLVSKMKAKWSRKRPWWLHSLVYCAQLNLGRNLGKQYYPRRYMEIYYEDLITSPEKTLRTITQHVGVAFDDRMLDYSEAAKKLVSDEEMQWKKETIGPLLSNNKEKWRRELSPIQIQFTQTACKESFTKDGYVKACNFALSLPMKWAAITFAYVLSRAFNVLYRLKVS